ncbi:sensor histidine kinase [Cribrihabitans sp. XS_ASV171]
MTMTMSHDIFSAVSDLTGDGLCLCEMITGPDGRATDYRFLRINDRFEEFTGLHDAQGRTAREMVPDLERSWIDSYARVGLDRETLRFEDGSAAMGRWFQVHATPGPAHGQLWILFRDVSDRKRTERDCEEALETTRHLFDELGHRVKNSLSLISAIVAMEARGSGEEAQAALSRLRLRISALAQLYHAMSEAGAISEIEAAPYLDNICAGLRGSLTDGRRIAIETAIDPVSLPSKQAVPLGLLLNELVTNCIKHGFGPEGAGRVRVTLRRADPGQAALEIRDNGAGIASGTEIPGLGTQLVAAFVGDLDGTQHIQSDETGTCITITFPLSTG